LLSIKKILLISFIFATIAIGLILVSFQPCTPGPTKTTTSEILANPATWENKLVEVEGVIDGVVTIPEIRLPFSYWLIDEANKTNRIGVSWTGKVLRAGEHALITGTVKSGYEKRLTAEGWLNSTLVYHIEAQAVAE